MNNFVGCFRFLYLLQRFRPICLKQSRQTSVREQFSARLALRAVIGFVPRVDDALDRRTANRTGFAVLAMDRHVVAEGSDTLGNIFAGVFVQPLDPLE